MGCRHPLREFLWSEEMADASVFVMEHVDFKDTFEPDDKEIRNCHINIGTGKEITIRQLAELIVEHRRLSGPVDLRHFQTRRHHAQTDRSR